VAGGKWAEKNLGMPHLPHSFSEVAA